MSYLQCLLAEAMDLPRDDPRVQKAIQALKQAKVIDRHAVARAEIERNPGSDYKKLMDEHGVSRGFVYNCLHGV